MMCWQDARQNSRFNSHRISLQIKMSVAMSCSRCVRTSKALPKTLSETVKDQQQRLGSVEKQLGLPNSAAPAERRSKATVEDVGWPLDLNKPKDRESVDKAISFHDL